MSAFEVAARPFFEREPFSTNVIGVHVEGVLAGSRPDQPGSLWVLVENGDIVDGAGMHTPPYKLFLGRLGDGAPEAVAATLAGVGRLLPGVTAERTTAQRFSSRWEELTGHSAVSVAERRMYVLDVLRPPVGVPGDARRATEPDTGLVVSWLRAFHTEASPDNPRVADEVVRQRIEFGLLWLWVEDDDPVSLAGVSEPAAGVARVGPVYTPPSQRRHGFGSAVTAAASRHALDSGAAHVALYTDLANPVSNSIYQAIGYVPDHDADDVAFANSL